MATERTVLVRLKGNASDLNRALLSSAAHVNSLRKEIDTTNDRTAWLAQGILALAPAAVPIGAAVAPAIAGLATQLGLAVGAVGTLALGFNGIGDSFKALNEYQLEPTAENLAKVREEFHKIGPDGVEFVTFLDEVGPKFAELQMAAREGMFPGMTEGLEDIVGMLPKLREVVSGMSEGIGQLSADAGEGLSGPRFEEFFDYLSTEAKPLLIEMGRTVGNFAAGLADMVVAFGPLTDQFSSGFLDMSRSFADWADGLNESDSFQGFLQYVQESVPMVLDLFGSFVNALVQFTEAAAPIGEIMVPAFTLLFDVLATLANTPIGPIFIGAAAAMSLYGRAAALASITTGGLVGKVGALALGSVKGIAGVRTLAADIGTLRNNAALAAAGMGNLTASNAAAVGRIRETAVAAGQVGAALGLVAVGATDLDEKIGLSNTATMALMGTLIAPGWGTAIGAAAGLTMDWAHANDALVAALEDADSAIASMDPARIEGSLAKVNEEFAKQRGYISGITAISPALGNAYEMISGKTSETRRKTAALENALAASRGELRNLGTVFPTVTRQAGRFSLAAERQAVALKEARKAAGETAHSFINMADAVGDGKKSLQEFLRSLERQAEDLRNFRINAEKAAEKGLRAGLIAELQKLGPEGARQMAQLANATKGEIDRANQAWRSGQREIQRYKDEVAGVPAEKTTKLTVDNSGAGAVISQTEQWLNSIQDEKVYVTVERTYRGVQRTSADGSTVPKTGLPYADRHHYLLADGEEVISNRYGQADKHRALLKAINANRLADGGTVAAMNRAVAASAASVRSERIVERVVERLPQGRVMAHVEGFGEVAMRFTSDVARSEIRAHAAHVERQNDRE